MSTEPTPREQLALDSDIAPEALIERYLAGVAIVSEAVAGMDDAQLRARPIEGKMSSLEVVNHIVDSEDGLGGRIKRALAGEEAPLSPGRPGHDGAPRAERALEPDLEALRAKREQLAEELRHAETAAWERIALRREDRVMTVRQLLILMVRHVENHVAAIEEKRAALGL